MGFTDKKKSFFIEALIVSGLFATGLVLRFLFLGSETADTGNFILWFNYVRDIGNISAFKDFIGDYNVTYVALLYLSTFLPFSDIVCVKLTAIFFDLLGPVVGFLFLREMALEKGKSADAARHYGELGAALVWLSPITIGNSGYQAQLEALWAFTGFLSLYLVLKKHPVWGMILFGLSFAMKPQGIFFLPVLVWLYYREKSFSILHFLIVPAVVQVLCIPSMLAGNSFFHFWKHFLGDQASMYPYVYYYYPNIWIWMRDLPYWVFGKVGIGMMLTVFALVTVRFVKDCRERTWTFAQDLELTLWALMTCVMFLPAMHERYNFPAEVMLPVLAVFDKKYRVPAGVLVVSGFLCNGMAYYGWGKPEFYGLSLLNMAVYAVLTAGTIGTLCGRSSVEASCEKGGAV